MTPGTTIEIETRPKACFCIGQCLVLSHFLEDLSTDAESLLLN
jgi:hypothetical protein